MLNEDYRDMLRILLENEVRFLVVGAYALGVYGHPRATADFDLWVDAAPDNSKKLYASIGKYGGSRTAITEQTFTEEGIIFQIGVAPRRIDIMTSIDGVRFQEAYANKTIVEIEGLQIPCISKNDLIKNKRSTNREKDKLDAEQLSRH
jgi:hypothetical protein